MNYERSLPVSKLRPHDIAVALQLALTPCLPYRRLAEAVGLSQGEVHNAVKRLRASRLLRGDTREVNIGALLEFLSGGVPYAFPAEPGPESRGVPTAHSAPPLASEFGGGEEVVWPSLDGQVRGASVEPLLPGAPATVHHNPQLYELLAIVDALRIGRARERQRARTLLQERLTGSAHPGDAL
jgi:DNA-binding Lrp family transcriptional regulator